MTELERLLATQGGIEIDTRQKFTLAAQDLVVEGVLRPEGKTYFLTQGDSKWGALSHHREVLGAALFAWTAGKTWAPVAGARVVLRLKPSFAAFDLCTNGDGTTIQIPFGSCTIPKGTELRLEIEAPQGYLGADVRVVLHGIQGEEVS